ncbi:MAG: LPP20 family lipoprotein, partial [Bacteroidota bacterium]
MKSVLTAFVLFACSMAFGQLKGAPDWVLDPPGDDFAFHGIGFANPQENENYRIQARNLALRELAEKIFISIEAKTELQVKYEDDRISYNLDERIEVASSNYLMGYELVDEWTSKKSTAYYVLFRLDRVTYMENRRKYFEQLDELVGIMDASAEELFDEGEMVRGINELSDAILRVDNEMHTIIEPEYARNLEKTKLGLIYQIERQLSRLTFDVRQEYAVDMSNPEPFMIE